MARTTKSKTPAATETVETKPIETEPEAASPKPNLREEDLPRFVDSMVEAINEQQMTDRQAEKLMNNIMDNFDMPKIVVPAVSLIHESDPFKKIEMAGRTCYKSEENITKESSKKFTKGLIKHGHTAMIEHASLVFELNCDDGCDEELSSYIQYLAKTDYLYVTIEPNIPRILASGNIRAILQRKVDDPIYRSLIDKYPDFTPEDASEFEDIMISGVSATVVDIRKLKDLAIEEFDKHFNLTAKFITDRGVTHEMVRHRPFSFAQESTRYCNYSKDKFGGHLTFCKPATYDKWTDDQKDVFLTALSAVDNVYNYLTSGENALQPQQARAVLPNCLKTEIVVSGPAFEWRHFFNLRSKGVTGAPHPDIKIVADEARKKMNRYLKSLKFDNNFEF